MTLPFPARVPHRRYLLTPHGQSVFTARPLSYGSIRADFVSALSIAMSRLYRAQLSARPT